MDRKTDIINAFENLRKKEIADKQPFKARAYAKVIQQIKSLQTHVRSLDDLNDVDGIGEKIKAKIQEILDTGSLRQAEEYKMRPDIQAIDDLLKVYGIGPAKAKTLVEDHGIMSINDLHTRHELLNEKQILGLKYWEDFALRIPRIEMDKHAAFVTQTIKAIDDQYIVEITGSFRRGEISSGDIDVLITHPDTTKDHQANFKYIIDRLIAHKYISDVLAQGPKKCLAVCRVKRYKHFRRIDLLMTHKNEFPFALLYFTGSGPFNVEMRNYAIEKGYSLSEYGLKCLSGYKQGGFVSANFSKEEDIFEFLGLNYVHPSDRKQGAVTPE